MTTSGAPPSVYVLVAGGGTGGHVYPALAVATELAHRGRPRESIRFVGSTRGLEARVVPEAGYEIDLFAGRGLARSLRPATWRSNTGAVLGAVRAFGRAFSLVGRLKPRVVLGVGGYASLPCVAAARFRRVPAVVHEQNATPGLANRIGVRLGARGAISLPGTGLRGAVLTGNPVRAEVAAIRREPANPPLVSIFGGSLGARRLNDAALELHERWRDRTDVTIRHVSGRRDFDRCAEILAAHRNRGDAIGYDLVAYEEDMARIYGPSALVVSRAGAVTVAELAITGMPAVLVPLPGTPGDHQTGNARALTAAGAAVLVPDGECDGERLAVALDALLSHPARLDAMSIASRSLAHLDAAARVADLVEEVAGGAT
jgi:UDP-N-acetylglucosamine--N-acetylmuramyl-(pentapeptide) pyrophosphoryl-undecaprenol N-acetylglucosamine transferase